MHIVQVGYNAYQNKFNAFLQLFKSETPIWKTVGEKTQIQSKFQLAPDLPRFTKRQKFGCNWMRGPALQKKDSPEKLLQKWFK